MNIVNTGMCRGEGRTYVQLESDNAFFCDVTIKAHTSDGKMVPCKKIVLSSKKAFQVISLAFPILTCSFSVHLYSQDTDQEKEEYSFVIDPSKAKWQSRVNRALKKDFIPILEKSDVVDYYKQDELKITGIKACPDYFLVQGAFFTTSSTKEPIVKVFDSNLREIESTFYDLGKDDSFSVDSFYAPVWKRRFSIKIPNNIMAYAFIARESQTDEYLGFDYCEQHVIERYVEEYWHAVRNAGEDYEYQEWLKNERATKQELLEQSRVHFNYAPLFSIVVPLFKTPLPFFDAMTDSVLAQSYRNFELILVNASPEDQDLSKRIQEYQSRDARVKQVTLEKNLGISGNTQAGIAVAAGDFVAFCDHDDTIEPDLFFHYAKALNEDLAIDLLYCDEDKIDEQGNYCHPTFKSDFNLYMLRTNNYVCHLLTIRKSVLDLVSYGSGEYDGAQDYNLTLQVAEKARRIQHISRILYHWRISPSSTAGSSGQKKYAIEAGRLSVQEHFKRLNINAESRVSESFALIYQPIYKVNEKELVSIVVPILDCIAGLQKCIESIESVSEYEKIEILLVGSNDLSPEMQEQCEAIASISSIVKVLNVDADSNISKIINHGVQKASGEYCLFLNGSTEVISSDYIERMLGYVKQKNVGAVGAKLLRTDGTIESAGIAVTQEAVLHLFQGIPRDLLGYGTRTVISQGVAAVSGSCMMVEKALFNKVKGFDEDMPFAYNDVDFCMKLARLGYVNVQCNDIELYQHMSLGNSLDKLYSRIQLEKEKALFEYRWAEERVKGDPNFNFNLGQSSVYMTLPPKEQWKNTPFSEG